MTDIRELRRAALAAAGLLAFAGAAVPARAGTAERVSVSSNGVTAGGKQGNDASGAEAFGLALSADGRFVGFVSFASNLVPGDTNGDGDVFVRDRLKGTTERVSVSSSGEQVVYGGDDPSLSADGRFVAFVSRASNLVPHDTNDATDVFVRDRETGRTERVSVGPNGHQGNIDSGVNGVAISADGRFVTFPSYATNLVEGGASGVGDIFVRDRSRRVTELVSVGPNGRGGDNESFYATISADGRMVAFLSSATNLVKGGTSSALGIYVRDRARRRTVRVADLSDSGVGPCQRPQISADGRSVAFATMTSDLVPHDTNGVFDVFVRDREAGRTERVNVSSHGQQADGVGFGSCGPGISAHGRFVAFESEAANLVGGDTNGVEDVFVHDRRTGRTERVSVGPGGAQGDEASGSFWQAISADGRVVAFDSIATNLVPHDTNGTPDCLACGWDAFVHTR